MHTVRPVFATRRHVAAATIITLLPGCVTTHTNTTSQLDGVPLSMSCSRDPQVDHEHFVLLSCAFENTGDGWLDVSVSTFDVAGSKLSTPAETQAFAEAWTTQMRMNSHNVDMALTGLFVAGALVGATSRSATGAGVGMAAMTAGGGGAVGRSVNESFRAAQYGDSVYGAGHVLGETLRIPPKSFLRRSVLLEILPPNAEAIDKGSDSKYVSATDWRARVSPPSTSPLAGAARLCFTQPRTDCTSVSLTRYDQIR